MKIRYPVIIFFITLLIAPIIKLGTIAVAIWLFCIGWIIYIIFFKLMDKLRNSQKKQLQNEKSPWEQ